MTYFCLSLLLHWNICLRTTFTFLSSPIFLLSFIHAWFYKLCFALSAAGAHWWLVLWSGHQPATWRLSAGDWPHSLHWDSRPHDFCDFLCLQWLLRCFCGHKEWTTKESKYRFLSSCHLLEITDDTSGLRLSRGRWGADTVKSSHFRADGSKPAVKLSGKGDGNG